jgi:centrosomal CEP192-like protein/immunoglobulin I-set domain protein
MQSNARVQRIRSKSFSAACLVLLGAVLLATGASANQFRGTISASPTSMNFQKQAAGTTSAPLTVKLTNNSDAQVTLTGVQCSATQFEYSGPALPATLSAHQSLSGLVTFSPAAASQYDGTLTFTISTGAKASAELRGTGTQAPSVLAPAITANPANLTVTAGQTATFSVAASGTAPMTYQWKMNGAAISGATSATYTTAATTTANSGETFSAAVTNSAGTATSSSATLTVNATPTMLLSANPSSLSFGNVAVGSSAVLPVTLTSSGTSTVTVTGVSISGAGFTPSGVSTGEFLAPGTSTMNITFAPADNVIATGTVTITSNATNSPTTISLSGTGTQVASYSVVLTWSPSTSSSVAGYNVYRGTSPGGELLTSPINTSLVDAEGFTDTNVSNGTTYYYVVTAVGSDDVQSADSEEASAVIP